MPNFPGWAPRDSSGHNPLSSHSATLSTHASMRGKGESVKASVCRCQPLRHANGRFLLPSTSAIARLSLFSPHSLSSLGALICVVPAYHSVSTNWLLPLEYWASREAPNVHARRFNRDASINGNSKEAQLSQGGSSWLYVTRVDSSILYLTGREDVLKHEKMNLICFSKEAS